MHARRADEDGDKQQHPPQEGDHEEQDFEVSKGTDTPEVIGTDLVNVSRNHWRH